MRDAWHSRRVHLPPMPEQQRAIPRKPGLIEDSRGSIPANQGRATTGSGSSPGQALEMMLNKKSPFTTDHIQGHSIYRDHPE